MDVLPPLVPGGPLREWLDAEDWRAVDAAAAVGAAGIVLVRRPYRDIRIRSKLVQVASAHSWDTYTHAFVFAGYLPGFSGGDGSRAQHGMAELELEGGPLPPEYAVPGLRSMAAASVPLELLPSVRVVHHIIQYETWVVPADKVADFEPHGFRAVQAAELSEDERSRFLFHGCSLEGNVGEGAPDSDAMREALAERGLLREEGMPDYVFVQRLANKIYDHIKYDAGKDLAMNTGKPPSHAFHTGYGQCGRYSAVLVGACRASGIPARMVSNAPEGNAQAGLFDPKFMHACAEVYLDGAGWTLLEPQNGKLGDFTRFIALDTSVHTEEQLHDARKLHPGLGGHVENVVNYYFQKHDVNCDGVLARDEVAALLADALGASAGSEVDVCQIDEALAALDLDGDGSLSRAELKRALAEERLWTRACGRTYSVGQSTCGGSLLRCPWPPVDTTHLLAVPAERTSNTYGTPVNFGLQNDMPFSVRQLWVNFEGNYVPTENVAAGTTYYGSCNTGYPFAYFNDETGREVACVFFTAPSGRQSDQAAKLSDAMRLCGTLPLRDPDAAQPLPLPGTSAAETRLAVMPSVEGRVIAAEACLLPRAQNPYAPERLATLPQPVVSLEYDRVEVVRLDPRTGAGEGPPESVWGPGPAVAPLFAWPGWVGGYVAGQAVTVPACDAESLWDRAAKQEAEAKETRGAAEAKAKEADEACFFKRLDETKSNEQIIKEQAALRKQKREAKKLGRLIEESETKKEEAAAQYKAEVEEAAARYAEKLRRIEEDKERHTTTKAALEKQIADKAPVGPHDGSHDFVLGLWIGEYKYPDGSWDAEVRIDLNTVPAVGDSIDIHYIDYDSIDIDIPGARGNYETVEVKETTFSDGKLIVALEGVSVTAVYQGSLPCLRVTKGNQTFEFADEGDRKTFEFVAGDVTVGDVTVKMVAFATEAAHLLSLEGKE